MGYEDNFWGNNSVTTFVKLKAGTDLVGFNNEIKNIEKKHYANGQNVEIFLYPLTKMRLYSRFERGESVGGRIEIMRLLGILGIFLILIACINFINLCTARAQRRSREIAIRKVTGAFRVSLIIQFLFESIIVALAAGLVSLAGCYLFLPLFSHLVQQQIPMEINTLNFWTAFLALILTIGILAGSYPAVYLSSFQPIRILKGINISSTGKNNLRSALVVFQFGFALTLIVSALIVSRQISFLQNRDSGYSSTNLIHLPLSGDLTKNFQAFSDELTQKRAATSITKTSAPITEQWSGATDMKWRGKDAEEKSDIERIYVDENMASTTSLTIIKGRDMDLKQFPSDSTAVLINETALRIMGFENPIGEIVNDANIDWHVIGVVKDFVFTSPFQKIEPIILFGSKAKWAFNIVYIKMNPQNAVQKNLALIAEASKRYNPDYPFEYQFADIEYQRKFDNLHTTLQLTTIFTTVAIFIACLGLFGLGIYVTEARMKEIGIRKVMGGSVLSITRLLSFSTLRPIVISVFLFIPVSWKVMSWWLESFAYKTSLDVWIFIIASGLIMSIAMITIASQTIKAAMINPVISLRNE
jgi:putative ABC transport system permease protein